jgi:hypothetical protein
MKRVPGAMFVSPALTRGPRGQVHVQGVVQRWEVEPAIGRQSRRDGPPLFEYSERNLFFRARILLCIDTSTTAPFLPEP